MTNPPTAADLIARAVPCIEYLVSQGCPGLPEWIRLFEVDSVILSESCFFDLNYPETYIENDSAVLDSIVVWVNGTVVKWFESSRKYRVRLPHTEWSSGNNMYFCWGISETRKLLDSLCGGNCKEFSEATIALLEAITEAVKGGSTND